MHYVEWCLTKDMGMGGLRWLGDIKVSSVLQIG